MHSTHHTTATAYSDEEQEPEENTGLLRRSQRSPSPNSGEAYLITAQQLASDAPTDPQRKTQEMAVHFLTVQFLILHRALTEC